MKNWFPIKKATASIATFALIVSQIASLPVANAADFGVPNGVVDGGEVYDLVLLVVDNTLNQSGNLVGLANENPPALGGVHDLEARVARYAEDLRDNNELTDVKIIYFDKSKDTVNTLSNALENIYTKGDTSAGHDSQLKGVVLIGDIPLPVVNKKGNRYVSLFPYTDFVDKAYSYNEKIQSFELNTEVVYPKPEIWHGVMRTPTNDQAGAEKLAEFFDKNHLYYSGDPRYSDFGKKLFFGDLMHEEEKMSGDMYSQYLKYLSALEDVAYFRYNKFWAKELSGQVSDELQGLDLNTENQFNKPTNDSPGFLAALADGSAFEGMPDIYSKNIIESVLAPYYKLVTKYLAKTNDWSESTGRYKPEEVDSVAKLINVKDEYTKYYIKSVNDALEKKINEVAEKIQEPVSIVDYSEISGTGPEGGFELSVTDHNAPAPAGQNLFATKIVDSFIYRFNYHNEVVGKNYINGIDTDLIDSPKLCSPLLGSTKSSYYDQNLDFNPKAVGGVYSILVRALRSDNIMTAAPLYTAGVNTRLLSTASISDEPSELAKATQNAYAGNSNADGVVETGAIVENNAQYGISAFLLNPLSQQGAKYENPWTKILQPGDVVTAVNGYNLSYDYTFDQAVSFAYDSVGKVIDSINNDKLGDLSKFPFKIAAYTEPPAGLLDQAAGAVGLGDQFQKLMILNTPQEIMASDRLKNHKVSSVVGIMKVDYYRGGVKKSENISFTIKLGRGDVKYPSTEDPEKDGDGSPEVAVLFNASLPGDFSFDAPSNGAIFNLYQAKNQGFGEGAYDSSAGCNAASTSKNSDRCFAKIAAMPVLDQGGSTGLVKMAIPGEGVKLKFPENVKKSDEGVNSEAAADYQNHADSFQIPSNYKYEDIDEVYYDSCFNGLPSVEVPSLDQLGHSDDSNLFKFPLDPSTNGFSIPLGLPVDPNNHDVDKDFYGRLLSGFGNFVKDHGDAKDVAGPEVMKEIANLDASQVILHNSGGESVSLKDFSDRYGLFDGKDNDGDRIADYEWKDTNTDGVYETKFIDYDEAKAMYGLPSGNLAEIARKMLSRTSKFVVPGAALADDSFDSDIELEVTAHDLKKISSVIVHNEPTMETINTELASMGAKSLPIDNPRYVAFQAEPVSGLDKYPKPQPTAPNINVDAIVGALDMNKYYTPGATVKVLYPNLFSAEITNVAQFNALINSKADELASAKGSYRIFGPNARAADYQDEIGKAKIKKEILDKYLSPVITNVADDPVDGFELKSANTKKIYDALRWKAMNIDEKHEYILKYYLNGSADFNPFVGESENGYEGAYLVMNGDDESFDFNFNKDVPEEKNTPFDPIVQMQASADAQDAAEVENPYGSDEDFQFVWLDQFLKESKKFLSAFTTVPKFENTCSSDDNIINALLGDNGGGGGAASGGIEQVQQAVAGPSGSGNKVELTTYTYLEIEGRSELEALIVKQAELFKESQKQSGNGPQTVDNGGKADSTIPATNGEGPASDTPADASGTKTDSTTGASLSTDSQDLSGNSDVAPTPATAEKILTGKVPVQAVSSQNFDQKIKDILSGKVGHEVTESSGKTGFGQAKNGEQGNTTGPNGTAETTTNQDGDGQGEVQNNAAGTTDGEEFHWFDYYIDSKYYEKFLEEEQPVSYLKTSSRLVASLSTDRMLAYLPASQNPFVDAETNKETKYLITASTNLIADGKSIMKVDASIFKVDGNLETSKQLKVKFEILDVSTGSAPAEIATFENGNVVTSKNGIATAYLRSGVHAGEFMVKATVVDAAGNADPHYQVIQKQIALSAGEVAKAEITAESTVLLANGTSKTGVVVTLKDAHDNVVNDALNNITVFINDLGYIDPKIDQNAAAVGTQVAVFDGRAKFELQSLNAAGVIELVALVTDSDLEDAMTAAGKNYNNLNFDGYVGDQQEFRVARTMSLNFKTLNSDLQPVQGAKADGTTLTKIGASLLADGEPALGFNGEIKFKLITNELGTLNVKPGVNMTNGSINAANVSFKSSLTAGTVQIVAEIPGFISDTLKFRSGEGEATGIVVTSSKNEIYTSGQDEVELTARIVDKNGNTVIGADQIQIHFTASDATKDFVKFDAATVATIKGVAKVKVRGDKISGMANIVVSHDGLKNALVSLKVKKHLNSSSIKEISPRALYVSLLGSAFGNVKNSENAAQNLLYTGQVEAVTSVTATGNEKKRMLAVDPYGKVDILADTLAAEIRQATDTFPYQKILVSDNVENKQLAEIFAVPQPNSKLILQSSTDDFNKAAEGIVVKDLAGEGAEITIEERGSKIYFVVKDETGSEEVKAIVDEFGRIKILSPDITLRLPDDKDVVSFNNFGLIIESKNSPVAAYKINEKFAGVTVLGSAEERQNVRAGVYVKVITDDKRYATTNALTRASTGEVDGIYILDTQNVLESSSMPGFTQTSLEDAANKFGLGFEGDNKHMLLFSAGSSVGEANNLYASDVGIIFGDPMVRVKKDDAVISPNTHFGKDIGKNIFSGQEDISQIVQMDYNGDGRKDLLLIYESGLVKLLENEKSNSHFRDRGYILDISGGTLSVTAIDLDNDGFDDLIAGTKEACGAEEQCLSVFRNHGGSLQREKLSLALSGKAYELKTADMNKDDCMDLVVSDSSGNIRIFNNNKVGDSCKGLGTNYVYTKNYGYSVDPTSDLSDDVYVNYSGISLPVDDPNVQSDDGVVLKMTLESSEPEASQAGYAQAGTDIQRGVLENPAIANADIPPQTYSKEFSFLPVNKDGHFAGSRKTVTDLNGGEVAVGDIIKYTITLKNNGGAVNNLRISDTASGSLQLDVGSVECINDGCGEISLLETGMSERPFVIKNINVPAGATRTITYNMQVTQVSKVHFDVGNDFANYPDNRGDGYPDVLVKPEVNLDNSLNYIYSVKDPLNGKIGYKAWNKSTAPVDVDSLLADEFKKAGIGNIMSMMGFDTSTVDEDHPVPDEIKDDANKLLGTQTQDKDYNGCADSWQKLNTKYKDTATAVANAVEGSISALRCSGGGCLPNPYNRALLVPSWSGPPGIAVFAAGVPNLIGIAALYPSTAPSTFRIYVSPTTTMGVGFAVCSGPSIGGTSPCYTFAVPGGVPGLCQGIKQGLDAAIASVPESVVNPDLGMSTVVSDGGEATDTKTFKTDESILPEALRDPKGKSPLSASASVNIRIPGFPSVITNWIDKEIDEIYNKLMDPMKFYLILPDFKGFFSMAAEDHTNRKKTDFLGLHDFLSTINRLPLIQIESKKIVMKIPAISKNQIEKYRMQGRLWLNHMKEELKKYSTWNCDESPDRKNICDKLLLDIQDLITSVQKLMDLLDRIENMPREILSWRNMEAKYANQIICYLDTVMQFTGGYINRQQIIVESWLKAAQDAIRTFKDWKVILDAVIDYQQSCDQCKNDRFSDLGLLLNVFLALPDIPVIPMPKLPDVVFDFSQIRTGVKFTWPDLVFKPEPILLPNLPMINLPDILPELEIKIPGFDVPDIPNLVLPELPDLPPLPIPELPDIPRPPRIPSIPHVLAKIVAELKPIFKILCLLKNGVIPVPEGGLKTEVETLTQPSIQVVLPLIKKLAVQFPEIQYDYVKEIRVTTKLNFNVNTDFIYKKAAEGAEIWNRGMKQIVKEINKYTTAPYGELLNKALQDAVDKAAKELKDAASKEADKVSVVPEKYNFVIKQRYLAKDDPMLNRSIAQIQSGISAENLPDNVGMNNLAELRDSLIAYSNSLEEGSAAIENMDEFSTFDHVLVNNDSLRKVAEITKIVDSGSSESTPKMLAFNVLSPQTEAAVQEEVVESKRLIADNFGGADAEAGAGAGAAPDASGTGKPAKGFYIVGDGGINENAINYTAELGGKTNVVFMDYDYDDDTDIVYSMGGEVYLKENFKVDERMPKGEVIVGLNKNSVSDFVSSVGAVEGAVSNYTGSEKADLSWKNGGEDVVGYEIEVVNSLLDDPEKSMYLALVEKADSDIGKELAGKKDYKQVFELNNKDEPKISLELPNGNYFARVFAINEEGERGSGSLPVLLSPQICADKEPPMPAVSVGDGNGGGSDYKVSVFKTLVIDASQSFDPNGKISEYYLEIVPYSNGAKKVTTLELPNDRTNPIFNIGPFVNEGDIGTHKFILHVVDEAGNSSKQEISVEVFAPEISLDPTFSRLSTASGETNPKINNIALSLMRNRYLYRVVDEKLNLVPMIQKVITKSADADGRYHTAENGTYSISDFNKEDIIQVQSAKGEIAAEVNGKNGNAGNVGAGYRLSVVAAKDGKPMYILMSDQEGRELGKEYVISDPNIDVSIDTSGQGVSITDRDHSDNYEFRKLGAGDAGHPGGAVLVDTTNSKQLAIVDTSGNIVIFDNKIRLRVKGNDLRKDNLIIEILAGQRVIGEVYINALNGAERVKIVGPNDVPFLQPNEREASTADGQNLVSAGDNAVRDLFTKGILEGQKTDTGFEYRPEQMINRAEFVKVVLKMLCIIPGADAYQPYASGKGYVDVPFKEKLDWYYPYIKESSKLGLVEGYKGERDEASGLLPFRPDHTVNRAEATKIILQALELKGIVDLKNIKEGSPWYRDYIKAGQNLTPYLKSGIAIKNNFIITPEEAQLPEEALTFEQLTEMALRVLDIYNCFEIDANQNGMSDFCEAKYDISDPSGDEDADGFVNNLECLNNSNPRDDDTDDGGMKDGDEFKLGIDILNPADDKSGQRAQRQKDTVVSGVYLVPAECNTCPCASTFGNAADVLAGDTFFSAITNKEENFFFSKSEEVKIESTK